MGDREEPTEPPATWENVVVGKAKKVVGHAIGDHDMTDEGEDQEEVAHEVREEYEDDHRVARTDEPDATPGLHG